MSSEKITLNATKRELLGKKVHSLRKNGQTPAVVHDHGKQSLHIAVDERELKKVINSAGKYHPVTLKLDSKTYTTLIKDITHRPASAQIYHIVFQAVQANETVKTEVPIKLVGEIPAERASLLVLQNLDIVEVEGLPKDLIDVIELDATGLAEAGDKLTVADLKIPSGIDIKTDPEQVIASVETPKDQIAEADAAAADLAADAGTEGNDDTETEALSDEGTAEGSKNAEDTDGNS